MGSAVNDAQRVATAMSTFGLSEVKNVPGTGKTGERVSNISKNAAFVGNTAGWAPGATARTGAGAQTIQNATKDAGIDQSRKDEQAQRHAADLAESMKRQPKKITSDNFLANKNKMLQNMRLGLAAMNSRGAAGAAAPSLSAPSLSGKSTLGS